MATPITAVQPVFSQGIHYVTSRFGKRTYYLNGKAVSDHHDGIDLVAKFIAADHVTAFADGIVEQVLNNVSGNTPSQGNYVKLRHSDNIYTVYYHLKKGSVCVKAGESIKAGHILGYMGSSGNSTGPHLHFGINIDGQWQNPEPYLTGKSALPIKQVFEGGKLTGVNINRGQDMMVLYRKKNSTETNKWGTEVPIDLRGIVLSAPVYGVGNMNIPEDGKVLSGHGLASKWILEHISEGDLVWFVNNATNISKGIHRSVLFNCIRKKDTLVVYNTGKYANTNPYGFEVAVDKNGIALTTPLYGKGKTPIPNGGFVLSGHGTEGKWLYSHVKKGTKIFVDKTGHTIKIVK